MLFQSIYIKSYLFTKSAGNWFSAIIVSRAQIIRKSKSVINRSAALLVCDWLIPWGGSAAFLVLCEQRIVARAQLRHHGPGQFARSLGRGRMDLRAPARGRAADGDQLARSHWHRLIQICKLMHSLRKLKMWRQLHQNFLSNFFNPIEHRSMSKSFACP